MDQPQPGTAHEALEIFVGRWLGTTELAASLWGPARTATAEVTFTRAAGGFAVVQSYRHTEADGTHFEGHGVFTVDPTTTKRSGITSTAWAGPRQPRPVASGTTRPSRWSGTATAAPPGTPSGWTRAC